MGAGLALTETVMWISPLTHTHTHTSLRKFETSTIRRVAFSSSFRAASKALSEPTATKSASMKSEVAGGSWGAVCVGWGGVGGLRDGERER